MIAPKPSTIQRPELTSRANSRTGQPTTAWPLAWFMVGLIVYASLYPFTDWRYQGISPFEFISAPWPQYWTVFDVASNLLGYAPLGFLLALSALRSRRIPWAVTAAVLASALLSLSMETLQSYLPARVASNLDLLLNIAGACLGAFSAWVLQKTGAIDRWSHFRKQWLSPDARGALVLLLLWPVALLFPAAVPLALGQVLQRLQTGWMQMLNDTPFLSLLDWPLLQLQPLAPDAELACVALGLLIPCLLGYGVVKTWRQRAVLGLGVLLLGVLASALSAALSYGPSHAWAWLYSAVQLGLAMGSLLALLFIPLPARLATALAALAVVGQLWLLNQAPADPYFAQTLQAWEQGRFIRFHGLAQWVGWLWPFAALWYALARVFKR